MNFLFKKICIASDHAGFSLKEDIKNHLINKYVSIFDLGPYKNESVDYPDYAKKLAQYHRITERMTVEPIYKKSSLRPPLSNVEIDRILSTFLEQIRQPNQTITETENILSEKCFELLIKTIPEVFAVMDLQGNIMTYNKALFSFLVTIVSSMS